MFYLDRKPFQISSYVIKTLVLRHEERYKEKQHKRLEKCVLRILHDLVHCCREKELQSLHNAKCNIFAKVGKRKLIATEKAIRLIIAALRQICERRIVRISAKRLRYDMKRLVDELRNENCKTVQQLFLNWECERWLRKAGHREFRNTRIDEAITEVVAAADAVAPATTAPAAVEFYTNDSWVQTFH